MWQPWVQNRPNPWTWLPGTWNFWLGTFCSLTNETYKPEFQGLSLSTTGLHGFITFIEKHKKIWYQIWNYRSLRKYLTLTFNIVCPLSRTFYLFSFLGSRNTIICLIVCPFIWFKLSSVISDSLECLLKQRLLELKAWCVFV